jgi:hypothetical protein
MMTELDCIGERGGESFIASERGPVSRPTCRKAPKPRMHVKRRVHWKLIEKLSCAKRLDIVVAVALPVSWVLQPTTTSYSEVPPMKSA